MELDWYWYIGIGNEKKDVYFTTANRYPEDKLNCHIFITMMLRTLYVHAKAKAQGKG